jgi:hypothetical protein
MVGDFIDGVREGHGTFTFANGDFYTGDFKNGCIEGIGTLSYCLNWLFYEWRIREVRVMKYEICTVYVCSASVVLERDSRVINYVRC